MSHPLMPVAGDPAKDQAPAEEGAALAPGFVRACRGIWLLTWKSRLTWRGLPRILLTLLAVPTLVFFTLEPLKRLATRADWREDPRMQIHAFREEAAREHVPLPPGIVNQLLPILTEEQHAASFARSQASAGAEPGPDGALGDEERARSFDQALRLKKRIEQRVRPLLEPRQFELFQRTQERAWQRVKARIQRSSLDNARPFFHWLIDFYLLAVLPLTCLTTCGSIIRDEVQADTLGFLLTRPISRAQLFLIKYGCEILWLESLVLGQALLLYAAGWAREAPGAGSTVWIFLGVQCLAVPAWGALSALLGLITKRYLLVGLAYGFVVEVGIGHIPTNLNVLALSRHVVGLLAHHPLLRQLYDWTPERPGLAIGILLLAVPLFLSIGAMLFTFREYHHAAEMQR